MKSDKRDKENKRRKRDSRETNAFIHAMKRIIDNEESILRISELHLEIGVRATEDLTTPTQDHVAHGVIRMIENSIVSVKIKNLQYESFLSIIHARIMSLITEAFSVILLTTQNTQQTCF